MNIEQIKRKISKLNIESLAKSSGFQKRKPKKLEIIGLLGGFWIMVLYSQHSLSSWSRNIFRISHCFISKQGLDKRLKGINSFGQALLKQVLKQPFEEELIQSRSNQLFDSFSNVYVEDSTCISLPSMLWKIFPGPHNRFGKSATARIQLRLNLLKDWSTHIELQSFRDGDGKYADQILTHLKSCDLVIRDLGYWALAIFKKIASKQAYFLTRLKYKTAVFDLKEQDIDLVAYLKKAHRNGQNMVDLPVLMGQKHKVKGRLIALKAPQKVVLTRKRKAMKNRNRRVNYKADYYYLLEWTILFTNVDKKKWKPQQVFQAYRFRWRIEIIFKCWKSKFKFEQLFKQHQTLHPNRAKLTLYLLLVMITLFYTRWYVYFADKAYRVKEKLISPFKFADFVKEHFWELFASNNLERFIIPVAYFCAYEKRRRPNHLELLFNSLS